MPGCGAPTRGVIAVLEARSARKGTVRLRKPLVSRQAGVATPTCVGAFVSLTLS